MKGKYTHTPRGPSTAHPPFNNLSLSKKKERRGKKKKESFRESVFGLLFSATLQPRVGNRISENVVVLPPRLSNTQKLPSTRITADYQISSAQRERSWRSPQTGAVPLCCKPLPRGGRRQENKSNIYMRRGCTLLARCLYSAPAARVPPRLPFCPALVGWPLRRECERNMLTLHDWQRASDRRRACFQARIKRGGKGCRLFQGPYCLK